MTVLTNTALQDGTADSRIGEIPPARERQHEYIRQPRGTRATLAPLAHAVSSVSTGPQEDVRSNGRNPLGTGRAQPSSRPISPARAVCFPARPSGRLCSAGACPAPPAARRRGGPFTLPFPRPQAAVVAGASAANMCTQWCRRRGEPDGERRVARSASSRRRTAAPQQQPCAAPATAAAATPTGTGPIESRACRGCRGGGDPDQP